MLVEQSSVAAGVSQQAPAGNTTMAWRMRAVGGAAAQRHSGGVGAQSVSNARLAPGYCAQYRTNDAWCGALACYRLIVEFCRSVGELVSCDFLVIFGF